MGTYRLEEIVGPGVVDSSVNIQKILSWWMTLVYYVIYKQ